MFQVKRFLRVSGLPVMKTLGLNPVAFPCPSQTPAHYRLSPDTPSVSLTSLSSPRQ